MRSVGKQFVAMAGLTLLESMRQPICLILTTTCLVFIVLLPFVVTHTLDTAAKLIRDSALAVHLVVGLLLAGYAACNTIVREVKSGTASAILSKPVHRNAFFLSKFAGVASLLLLFSLAATMTTLVATRIAEHYDETFFLDLKSLGFFLAAMVLAYAYGVFMNYFHHRPFISQTFISLVVLVCLAALLVGCIPAREAAGAGWFKNLPWSITPASILVTWAVLVLAALSVSLATRLEVAPTLALCGIILMIGLMSDYLFGRPASEGHLFAGLLYTLVPNWQHFWAADALGDNGLIRFSYLLGVSIYGLCYGAGVLCVGMWTFNRMELK